MTTRKAPVGANPTDIDITEILERIPHRFPFLLVDRCEDYKPSESIVGIKCVTVNEPFFQGHFPHYPVMPAVLLIEAMAQTGAVLMSKSLNVDVGGKAIFFMSADNCRFRAPVRPGDVVRMPVRVTRHRGDIFKFAGQAMVDGKVAAECEFAAMVVET
ncbi:3-hydroxyacyl-ACP dehydratase FabZ [uncultured Phenylobacterium sp.]|uniref:3-hydroxyacyl-ACP dehydratase FabZ n=1 Tax=uncultured Phenylobacterium sp. TaxID=349273 RepID=UPI0025FA689E|nr:3-hydroxyacyl-ACP dehydratase FabZ [uncultured Phenylobacterium sp.]